MSETPRADAFDAERSSLPAIEAEHDYSALLDFARTLERENAALREQLRKGWAIVSKERGFDIWPTKKEAERLLSAGEKVVRVEYRFPTPPRRER